MTIRPKKDLEQAGIEGGWICIGAFAGSHGVRGDVKLKSFTEQPEAIFSYSDIHIGAGGSKVALKKVRASKDGYVARVEGVTNPEDALKLKGKRLYIPRDTFSAEEDDEFYLADLIALTAVDESGSEIGFVKSVENFGAEDLLELILNAPVKGLGRSVFIPFRKALVPVVDIKAGRVEIAFSEWQKSQVSERDTDDAAGEQN
ncbi:ribosome maturation factor RimM [Kordiimonas laminariae]|uniref:ribosome maturation factor RimM n=1 Tax=Kordiimonas laminariae TaxID=2917717 RepID=UPI001FF3CC53|nr:ribosome maturation factor RimM [Kordiimonas laminariae]MCK0068419.1 ribosome maturation factor RimM [Kordiimonas laminariae]